MKVADKNRLTEKNRSTSANQRSLRASLDSSSMAANLVSIEELKPKTLLNSKSRRCRYKSRPMTSKGVRVQKNSEHRDTLTIFGNEDEDWQKLKQKTKANSSVIEVNKRYLNKEKPTFKINQYIARMTKRLALLEGIDEEDRK